jgi:pyruvate dehydrogenase E2 component (dihydrolipoamide acetyltransferase)
MADVIRMPLLSDTMTEGKIAVWNKKVGDAVKSDESIADVETDKATMEVLPYVDGILLYVGVEAGQSAKVNDIIAIIGKAGENIDSLLQKKSPEVVPSKEVSIALPDNTVVSASPSIEIPKELTVIRMPLLSDTMTEGKIVVWNKQVGDTVKADDALADVETDKATMEVIGYADGVLLYQGIKAGEAAKINEVIAVIGKAGTDITPYLSTLQHKEAANTILEKPVSTASSIPTTPSMHEVQKVDTLRMDE